MNQKVKTVLFFALLATAALVAVLRIRSSIAAPAGGACEGDCMAYMPWQIKPVPTATPTATATATATPSPTATSIPATLDFTVTDIEIFQASQTNDNAVPLVAGKTGVARIYAQLLAGTSPNNVQVSITAVRNGNTLGTVNASGPTKVPASPSHGSYNTTYNVILPSNWLSGQVKLTAKVDPGNDHPEANENNNQFSRTVTFTDIPDLQIRLIPIDYVHTGPTNPGDYPGQAVDNISDWIARAYPMESINVNIRPSHLFIGNLETNLTHWENLLDDMFTIKLSDGLPEETPIVYYGLIPIKNGSEQWFYGGVAGIGWISPPGHNYRESIGLNLGANDDTGILAGHEIGHNLGRQHAPCGGAAGVDPNYPYSGASIGRYGTDIQGSTVSFYTPDDHVDMMSYCSPEWVSDYTYTALYNNQLAQGLLQTELQPTEKLVIRASFTSNGLAVDPVYAFAIPGRARALLSGMMVELLDSNGDLIASHPIAVREVHEDGIQFRSVVGTVPLPAESVASLRLVEDGAVLAERPLTAPQTLRQTAVSLNQTAEAITLNWGLPDVPAIVRYTTDDGATWTTVALDVMGGSLSVPVNALSADGRFEIILANTGAPAILTADFTLSP
ncbi:MAG: hypothetical protein H6658_15070 [Ardenticatenaceae bacterium]|nr:hypothetical protein [Ardenticatenaceae bacterium]